MRQAQNNISKGPKPVSKNAHRQPKESAIHCDKRNESPTPNEKLEV
jgi:hypothetical protein